jgi:hypothetical protein
MNNSNSFEKPKDWNVAPESSWVSGTPIGQSGIKMPNLGDPGSHENASQKVSFGDDDPQAEGMARIGPGGKMISPGQPCPPGYKSDSGACVADPKSTASPEARKRAMQKGKEKEEEKFVPGKSAKREPALPAATDADPQIKRIAKEGYKGR